MTELKIVNGCWVDNNNNKWSQEKWTLDEAKAASESLVDCTCSARCKGCIDCTDCTCCADCTYCTGSMCCARCAGCADYVDCANYTF